MSDDRFDPDSTVFKKPEPSKDWDGTTLEEWVRRALAEGRDAEVVALLRVLPDTSREKYRAIWREVKGKAG